MHDPSRESASADGARAVLGCHIGLYLTAWCVIVLPILVLGVGFAGGVWPALKSLAMGVVELEPFSIFVTLFSAPLVCVPFILWRYRKAR